MTTEMRDARPLAIALMGPTAAGKTALAVRWAQQLETEVISVDSALVYRGLDIGAAKPDAPTRASVRHHLLDIREPTQAYCAADFRDDALAAMAGIAGAGRIPVLAGGTSLYFRALLHGLSDMPEADPRVRAELAARACEVGWPALHGELARVDPAAAARIHANDPQRISRALEVFQLSGRPISQWQQSRSRRPFPYRVLKLAIVPEDRRLIHARIASRFDAMVESGLLDEVRRLRDVPGVHPDLPAMRAVGYRQAWQHLDGDFGFDEFRNRALAATRQLAKRQLTWLRGMHDLRWVDAEAAPATLEQALQQFVTRS